MSKLARGEDILRYSLSAPHFEWSRWTALDTSSPILAGHSLGGAAVVCRPSKHNNISKPIGITL
jgi:platelet-activating factor acetylhydrolase